MVHISVALKEVINKINVVKMKDKIELEKAGIILMKEFIDKSDYSIIFIADMSGVGIKVLYGLIGGSIDFDKESDEKLTKFFKVSKGYFLRLQEDYNKGKENNKNKGV